MERAKPPTSPGSLCWQRFVGRFLEHGREEHKQWWGEGGQKHLPQALPKPSPSADSGLSLQWENSTQPSNV